MKWQLPPRIKALWQTDKQRANLLLLAGMAGILLLGASEFWPASSGPDTAEAPAPTAEAPSPDYAQALEERLQALLGQVEGAGRVEVMVTLAAGEQTVYAKDSRLYADGSGEQSHVLLDGDAPALVETVAMPSVQGVAVLCEGGGSALVQDRITQIVDVLTGVGTDRITVAALATPHEGG